MPQGILPSSGVLAIIRKVVLNKLVNLSQRQHFIARRPDRHGSERDVRVRRLLVAVGVARRSRHVYRCFSRPTKTSAHKSFTGSSCRSATGTRSGHSHKLARIAEPKSRAIVSWRTSANEVMRLNTDSQTLARSNGLSQLHSHTRRNKQQPFPAKTYLIVSANMFELVFVYPNCDLARKNVVLVGHIVVRVGIIQAACTFGRLTSTDSAAYPHPRAGFAPLGQIQRIAILAADVVCPITSSI